MERKSTASISSSPRDFRTAFTAAFRKYILLTPGIATGYWKDRNNPAQALSSGDISNKFSPLKLTVPLVTIYFSFPTNTFASVLLPVPLRPMITCSSPGLTSKFIPFRISFSSTLTLRFSILIIIIFHFSF